VGVIQKMLSNEELLIALRRQVNFDRKKKAIDQKAGRDRLFCHV
jgi:hypothetical protein